MSTYPIFEHADLVSLVLADSLEYLKTIPDNTFHGLVTDPPYGLGEPPDPAEVLAAWATVGEWVPRTGRGKGGGGFMGHAWDRFVPGVALWREVLRVLKPGAFCAVFAGSRMWDWMSIGMRFAGFQVADSLIWLHGNGMPKVGDISKRIDEHLGAERQVIGYRSPFAPDHPRPNKDFERFALARERAAQAAGTYSIGGWPGGGGGLAADGIPVMPPATELAAMWEDCSPTLRPGFEPIVLARKAVDRNNLYTCMTHQTGALRIGECRIRPNGAPPTGATAYPGRWPANVLMDQETAEQLDRQYGVLHSRGNRSSSERKTFGYGGISRVPADCGGQFTYDSSGGASRFFTVLETDDQDEDQVIWDGADGGNASETDGDEVDWQPAPEDLERFRYIAKVSKREKHEGLQDKNAHPTVKPVKLMRWLVRLVVPPWGIGLDPFAGSGSTGKAAIAENRRFVLVEREPEYVKIANARIAFTARQMQCLDQDQMDESEQEQESDDNDMGEG